MRGKIRRVLFYLSVIFLSFYFSFTKAYAKNATMMDYIEQIESRKTAFIDDALVFILFLKNDKIPDTYEGRLALAVEKGYLEKKFSKAKNSELTRGNLSLLLVRSLDLKGSFLYWLFGTGRFSYRLLVYHNIMLPLKSEWDSISTDELMEVIRLASEYQDRKK